MITEDSTSLQTCRITTLWNSQN